MTENQQINRSEYFIAAYRPTKGTSPTHNKFTKAEIKKAQQMQAKGRTQREIAQKLGRSVGAISKILKKHGLLKS